MLNGKHTRGLIMLTALALSMASCSSTETPETAPSTSGVVSEAPQGSRLGQSTLDSSQGRLTTEDLEFLSLAEEELVAKCMTDRGFKYTPIPPQDQDETASFAYGNDDAEWAAQNGYQINNGANEAEPPADANAAALAKMSESESQAWSDALTGTEAYQLDVTLPDGETVTTFTDSCTDKARTQLYGDIQQHMRLKYTAAWVDDAVVEAATADPRFVSVQQSWSSCMKNVGYNYATSSDARNSVGDATYGEVRGLEAERALAVADATCTKTTGLLETAGELDAEYRATELKQREGEILAYDEQRVAAVERGKELLNLSR